MKERIRNGLSLLLCAAVLVSVLPFAASAAKDKTLYTWTASTMAADNKVFATNLISSDEVEVYWNETGVMYTDQGTKQLTIRGFLNEVGGHGTTSYGLPQASGVATENLRIDTYPMVNTAGMESVDLSFLYAYKPDGKSLNPANSGLLNVCISEDGMTWSEDCVGVRSAQIVGCGTTQKGETVIYYEIHCEDLMDIDGLVTGDKIRGVRIMPDGKTGTPGGDFSLCELTLTGYESKAAFKAAVPVRTAAQSSVTMAEDEARKLLVDAATRSTASSALGKVIDALSMVSNALPASARNFLNTEGIRLADGIDTKAKDTIHELLARMQEWDIQMTPEKAGQILAKYESLETTGHIVKNLNTPQQIFRAYANVKPGDLLLRITDSEAAVYMITGCNAVYYPDGVNVDFPNSKMTYLTTDKGEQTQPFFELFGTQEFVPLTVSDLLKNISSRLDVYASMTDGVRVAVVSDLLFNTCKITVGDTTVALNDLGKSSLVCSGKKLSDAVAALADGKHTMTVTVVSGLGGESTTEVEFEVKDGKATVLGTVAPDHEATCKSKAMTDVDKNAWYHEAVDYALANGLMGGYNATTFGPNDTLSRAMVVQVIYNKEGQPAISGKHSFTDVPADQWFNNAITWGTQKGVMGGYGDGKFGPNDNVTLEQLAVILWNYSGNPAFSGTADSVGAHSSWAANGLAWALENGILENVPYENVTVGATRAQTAQMFMNYLTAN